MKIGPELVEVLEKRYNILRTIYYKQPIGRRILANDLNLGERIVRTEINFLKVQGLIEVNTPGMTVTQSGEELVNKLINKLNIASYANTLTIVDKLSIIFLILAIHFSYSSLSDFSYCLSKANIISLIL